MFPEHVVKKWLVINKETNDIHKKEQNMRTLTALMALTAILTAASCKKEPESQSVPPRQRTEVITHDLQSSMTPKQIFDSLKRGNERFVAGALTSVDYNSQIIRSEDSQYPAAVILSCLDSRVPVETIFDLAIGDVFVARVAGNISNADILASMEYACKVSGSKLVLVLGHTNCGAVKSAIDDVKLGNITELLAKIRPAVDSSSGFAGEKSAKNKDYVFRVTDENVKLTMENIRKNSPILKEMEDKGEIDIIGGLYHLDNGKVDFFD